MSTIGNNVNVDVNLFSYNIIIFYNISIFIHLKNF